jgi:hypothetical protein
MMKLLNVQFVTFVGGSGSWEMVSRYNLVIGTVLLLLAHTGQVTAQPRKFVRGSNGVRNNASIAQQGNQAGLKESQKQDRRPFNGKSNCCNALINCDVSPVGLASQIAFTFEAPVVYECFNEGAQGTLELFFTGADGNSFRQELVERKLREIALIDKVVVVEQTKPVAGVTVRLSYNPDLVTITRNKSRKSRYLRLAVYSKDKLKRLASDYQPVIYASAGSVCGSLLLA